ncbi:hypothetical protein P4118_21360 [Pseudomonas aeruginosa]|nr:hypothetical protein [Pseudomonas aeruginosa]
MPSARKGRVAAFAVTVDGEEGIGIAAEIGRGVQKSVPAHELIDSIRQAVAEATRKRRRWWRLLNPGALPRRSAASCSVPPAACAWKTAAWTAMRCSRPPGRAGERSRRRATTNCWHASARSGRPGWAWRR